MSKIKVKKELFDALEELTSMGIKFFDLTENESILRNHARLILSHCDEYKKSLEPISKLGLMELAEILDLGYEKEESPEEKIYSTYFFPCINEYDRGFKEGIEFTLKELGIIIKGINA